MYKVIIDFLFYKVRLFKSFWKEAEYKQANENSAEAVLVLAQFSKGPPNGPWRNTQEIFLNELVRK